MSFIKIHPLHVGTITRQKSTFGYRLEPGKVIDAPLIAWYIEGAEKKILVDTGGGDPAGQPKKAPYRREEGQSIENALGRIGVGVDDIDIVITTHLHWDHCAGNGLFPKAQNIVQEEELRTAKNPFPVNAEGYIPSMVKDIRYTVISGDSQIVAGVSVILTPGHTYGMQGVLVRAASREYFIAGDTIGLFECLDRDPPLISGVYVDLKKYYESLERIKALSATVLPGHDMKVFDERVYL